MTDSNEVNQHATSIESMERRLPHIESPYALRQEIARTRAHMGRTIDDLQKKLSPERLKAEAQEALREATIGKVEEMANTVQQKAKSWRTSVVDSVRENPIPAAMVGAGLAWMLFSKSSDDDYYGDYRSAYIDPAYRAFSPNEHYYGPSGRERSWSETIDDAQDRVSDVAENVREEVGETVETVRNKAADVQHNVQQRASEVKRNVQQKVGELEEGVQEYAHEFQESAQQQWMRMQREAERRARMTKRSAQQIWNENPLAVGLAAMAAGALFAALLPPTEVENRWMGDTRDQLVDQVQQTAQEGYQKAQRVVEEAVDTVEKDAKGLTEHVKSVARDVKKAATEEAERQNLIDENKKSTESQFSS